MLEREKQVMQLPCSCHAISCIDCIEPGLADPSNETLSLFYYAANSGKVGNIIIIGLLLQTTLVARPNTIGKKRVFC